MFIYQFSFHAQGAETSSPKTLAFASLKKSPNRETKEPCSRWSSWEITLQASSLALSVEKYGYRVTVTAVEVGDNHNLNY